MHRMKSMTADCNSLCWIICPETKLFSRSGCCFQDHLKEQKSLTNSSQKFGVRWCDLFQAGDLIFLPLFQHFTCYHIQRGLQMQPQLSSGISSIWSISVTSHLMISLSFNAHVNVFNIGCKHLRNFEALSWGQKVVNLMNLLWDIKKRIMKINIYIMAVHIMKFWEC